MYTWNKEEFDEQWAEDDEPRLRSFAVDFIDQEVQKAYKAGSESVERVCKYLHSNGESLEANTVKEEVCGSCGHKTSEHTLDGLDIHSKSLCSKCMCQVRIPTPPSNSEKEECCKLLELQTKCRDEDIEELLAIKEHHEKYHKDCHQEEVKEVCVICDGVERPGEMLFLAHAKCIKPGEGTKNEDFTDCEICMGNGIGKNSVCHFQRKGKLEPPKEEVLEMDGLMGKIKMPLYNPTWSHPTPPSNTVKEPLTCPVCKHLFFTECVNCYMNNVLTPPSNSEKEECCNKCKGMNQFLLPFCLFALECACHKEEVKKFSLEWWQKHPLYAKEEVKEEKERVVACNLYNHPKYPHICEPLKEPVEKLRCISCGKLNDWESGEFKPYCPCGNKSYTFAVEEPVEEKYHELLMAVGNKYPGETRHQTALRYIEQAESKEEPVKKLCYCGHEESDHSPATGECCFYKYGENLCKCVRPVKKLPSERIEEIRDKLIETGFEGEPIWHSYIVAIKNYLDETK